MPKCKILSKFIIDPAYDMEKGLQKEIDEARAFFNKELVCIDNIEDTTLQLICIFALIDRLAQESENYPKDFKQAFYQFVIKHQKQCDYIEEVDPVTLYYHVEDYIDEKSPLEGFPPEKEVNLESLGYLFATTVKDILPKKKSEELLKYIENKKGAPFANTLRKKHQIISLIYRMRNKAVHEMTGLGESIKKLDPLHPKEPYYMDVGRTYVYNDDVVSDDVVELVIPNCFLRNILSDCIDGYLEECLKEKRSPFSNNRITRLHHLSWYDEK